MLVHLKLLADHRVVSDLRSLLNVVLIAWIHHLLLLRLVIVGVSVSYRCCSS